jgi:hypothetical protein
MRLRHCLPALGLLVFLISPAVRALDNVNTYICPNTYTGSGMECFLEAVPQTYTMCRHIKSIEIIEFGIAGAQQGVNGAKTASCIQKHKLTITRPYQAALREAARNKQEVVGVRKLYDMWLLSLAQLTPGPTETDENYKLRVVRPYGEFNSQIAAIRAVHK